MRETGSRCQASLETVKEETGQFTLWNCPALGYCFGGTRNKYHFNRTTIIPKRYLKVKGYFVTSHTNDLGYLGGSVHLDAGNGTILHPSAVKLVQTFVFACRRLSLPIFARVPACEWVSQLWCGVRLRAGDGIHLPV